MASYYVYSGAAGAGTGADWANAYTLLDTALSGKAAGDIFYLADDHVGTRAGSVTFTSPGTAASPCQILCVRRSGGSVPPVSADLRATASEATSGSVTSLSYAGFAYVYGVVFACSNTGNAAPTMLFTSGSPWCWILDTCELKFAATSGGSPSTISVGALLNSDDALLRLVNTNLRFSRTNQGFLNLTARFEWLGGSLLGSGTDALFVAQAANGQVGLATVSGVDLSIAASGAALVNVARGGGLVANFNNCKLGSSVSIATGSVAGQGGVEVRVVNCDSADTNYRYYRQTYQGTITQETTIVRTGGASDGTTIYSRKMVSTANSKFYSPQVSDYIEFWNDTLSSTTVTVPVLTDNVTLTDAEAWVEVEELGTSGFPLSVSTSDRAADILATPANQTTDGSSTWTTTGLGTPVKQSLSVTFTPTGKGWVRARVMLAKASTTLYFDPKILTGAAQYMAPGGEVVNYPASGGGAIIIPAACNFLIG